MLGRQFSSTIKRVLVATAIFWPRIAMDVPSSTTQNDYGWMADIDDVREWIGEREVNNLSAFDYTIKNKSWELTVGVDRDHIEDDNLGIYDFKLSAMAEKFAKHPDKLIAQLMKNGHTSLCYDGQYFFDTDHPAKDLDGADTTWANYEASGRALTLDNAMLVRAKMLSLTSEKGSTIASNPRLLVVPPQLEAMAIKICNASIVAEGNAGVTNIANLKSIFEYIMIRELANQAGTWYLLDVSQIIKPFIVQRRREVNLVSKTQPNDEGVFWQKKLIWGCDARYNVGYALWQLAYKAAA